MLQEFKNFFREEEGGADQLIIAAIMVMGGISVAIFFGEQIMDTVNGFIKSFTQPEEVNFEQPEGS